MDSLKEWAAIICSVSVGSVFTVFVIPDGKMKKFAETVVSFVFLLLVISLVADVDIDKVQKQSADYYFSDEIQEYNSADFYSQSAKEFTENFVCNEISDICSEKFTVKADIFCDDDNVFVLDCITITIDKKDATKVNEIKNKVSLSAGIVPEVVILR